MADTVSSDVRNLPVRHAAPAHANACRKPMTAGWPIRTPEFALRIGNRTVRRVLELGLKPGDPDACRHERAGLPAGPGAELRPAHHRVGSLDAAGEPIAADCNTTNQAVSADGRYVVFTCSVYESSTWSWHLQRLAARSGGHDHHARLAHPVGHCGRRQQRVGGDLGRRQHGRLPVRRHRPAGRGHERGWRMRHGLRCQQVPGCLRLRRRHGQDHARSRLA